MSELPEKDLDSGLRAAFEGPAPDQSVLKALGAKPLHLPGGDREPATDATGRYQTVGEIARGGVGVIYKGRDIDLGRDVAIKVLRDEFKEDSSVSERFVEEAQIGGQLQHPGIVPVYELGLDDSQRPYFSMKLVKGKTLAARMKDGSLGPRRLLGIFEKVCETMAYAHARGVVHRDLKPSNIMVGAFGEVQIVDWGFAKVLREGGIADEKARPDVSVIATVRSAGEGSESIAGSVMGTPAYMPPEQALGQVEALDETSDVFSLGAILFEILTGRKLYEKSGKDNLIVLAAQCRLDEQLALLDGHELGGLVRRCLAMRQSDRPKDAGSVERAISRHLASVEERAHAARVAAAEAHVRAQGERRKRALTLVLGAAVLTLVVLTGGGWWLIEKRARDRNAERTRAAHAALDEATLLRGRGKFGEALDAARRAVEFEDTADTRAAVARAERELKADEVRQAQKDREDEFEKEFARISTIGPYDLDPKGHVALYERAFKRLGVDPTDAEAWRDVRDSTRLAAAWAMAEWARKRRVAFGEGDGEWKGLIETAKRIDPDPLRNELRDALRDDDAQRVVRVAGREDPAKLDALSAGIIGWFLIVFGETETAVKWLRRGRDAHPADWMINLLLGWKTDGPESIGALTAAMALKPDHAGGRVLLGLKMIYRGEMWLPDEDEKQVDAAIEIWRDTLRVQPDCGYAAGLIGIQLDRRDDREGARAEFDDAIRRDPRDYRCYYYRAVAFDQTEPAQAIRDYQESLRLRDAPNARGRFANLLANAPDESLRDPQEAIRQAEAGIRLAVRIKEKNWEQYCRLVLGYGQYRAGDYANALAAFEAAAPQWATVYGKVTANAVIVPCFLAMAHWQLGHEAEARKWLERANQNAKGRQAEAFERDRLEEARALVK